MALLLTFALPGAALAQTRVVAWGANDSGQTNVPAGLTDVMAIAAGTAHNLVLRADGTVLAWGANWGGQTDIPVDLANVVAIAAGEAHSLALRADGTVVAWGGQSYVHPITVPAGLTNVVAIVAGSSNSLALRADGTVVEWGTSDAGPGNLPAGLTNVVHLAAGYNFDLALRADGSVFVWGNNDFGQTNVPSGVTNAVGLAGGIAHCLALRSDGSVLAWGINREGQTNVPSDVTNAVAIAAGGNHSLALRADGTLVAWGANESGQTNVPADLTEVAAIAAGYGHSLALHVNRTSGPPLVTIPSVSREVLGGGTVSFQVTASGQAPLSFQWRFNETDLEGATNPVLLLTNVQPAQAGLYAVVVSNALGAVTNGPARLTVLPLRITTQPLNRAARPGETVTFRVEVQSTAPCLFQWQVNGTNLPDAINASLTLTVVTTNQSGGAYRVMVANAYGATESAVATLTVWEPGSFFDDFEAGIDLTHWSDFGGTVGSTVLTTNHGGSVSGVNALWFGADDSRYAASHALNTTQGGVLDFWLRIAGGSSSPWEQADLPDEGIVVEYSTNSGGSWMEFGRYDTNPYMEWTHVLANIPAAAQTENTQIRWRQLSHSGTCCDHWALDDVGVFLGPQPPAIAVQPQSQTVAAGRTARLTVGALGSSLFYQWQFNGMPIPDATNSSLVLTSVTTNQAGTYFVLVSNALGSVTSSNALLTVLPVPASEVFQIVDLSAEGADAVEHYQVTGDDRGGIAASSTRVFYSGDDSTGAFDLEDLSDGQRLDRLYDSLVSDLKTETVYVLANGDTPLAQDGGWFTSLLELDGETGLPTGERIDLTEPIQLPWGSGVFAGFGCVVVHNGTRVYTIDVPSGVVVDEGAMSMPNHVGTENWAFWGVAEYFDGTVWLAYVRDVQSIVRSRVPDGLTLSVASFANLSDMACFTVCPRLNRWYFHHEGSSQFGGGDETIGYAEAAFFYVQEPRAPQIYRQPSDQTVMAGRNARFSVGASGSPLFYQWQCNGFDIQGATNLSLKLSGVTTNEAGPYAVIVSNALGSVTSAVARLVVNLPGTRYVWQDSPRPAPPYTNWATAAHTIQAAVDLAWEGDMVLVTNGVYATGGRAVYGLMTNRVAIEKPITVLSVNGAQVTIIEGAKAPSGTNGDGAVRCVFLTNGATLSGFTLTNGGTRSEGAWPQEQCGGGVWCETTNAVVFNCVVVANSACYGGGAYAGTLDHCTLAGNWAYSGGGAYGDGDRTCALFNCILNGNRAADCGGGAGGRYGSCVLYNCSLTDNSAGYSGGGAAAGTLYNCTLMSNSAQYGGGAGGMFCFLQMCPSTLYNCTLTGNSAQVGGGTYPGNLYNCIVYDNTAPDSPNYVDWGSTFAYSCTTPLPPGEGNIDADPQLDDTLHLMTASPCIGAGSSTYSQGVDMDGEPWLEPPSMGADEYGPSGTTGALTVALKPTYALTEVGLAVRYTARIHGWLTTSIWDFADGTVVSNLPSLGHAWSAPGTYTVRLTGYNDNHPEGVTATGLAQVVEVIHYVNRANATPQSPFTTWQSAATNIQDAIDATEPGGWVLVTNGLYGAGAQIFEESCVFLNKPITVRSVNGPAATVIQGTDAARCAYVGEQAVLSGFTLTNGHAAYGGGVWSEGGLVTNCVLTGNRAEYGGGGACGGNLWHCIVTRNFSPFDAGGALGSCLHGCLVAGNVASMIGGGVSDGLLYNCTVAGNSADTGGGAIWSRLYNSVICENTASDGSNHICCDMVFSCTTPLPPGEGNIARNPAFLNPAVGDFRLHRSSPCIDAGADLSALFLFDLAGVPRPLDGNGDGVVAFDMGAYEFDLRSTISWAWFSQHGLDPGAAGTLAADPDHDGRTTYQEWVADTDPTNAWSCFHVTSIVTGPPVSVSVESSATRLYTLESCADLSTGLWTSVPGQTDIPGTGGPLTLTDPNAAYSRFYRVSVRQP